MHNFSNVDKNKGMEANIQQIFDEVQEINIYRNGNIARCLPSQMSYKLVINGFKNLLAGARQMPAFGVSLNDETKTALSSGTWVEFDFKKRMEYDEMPFEKLLMETVPAHTGFNLSRYNSEGGYSGRCYYFDLPRNMEEFYDILQSV